MSAGNNITSADPILKDRFTDAKIDNSIMVDNPLLALMPKNEKVDGRQYIVPMITDAGQGRSATFSNAQAMSLLSGESFFDFKSQLVENFGVATVSSRLLSETESDLGSFVRMTSTIVENQLANMANDLAVGCYRSSDGARGQVDASTVLGSNVLVLKNPADALNFSIGMSLDGAQNQSTGSKRAYGSGGHGLYVSGVDFVKGQLLIGSAPVAGASAVNISDSVDGCPTLASQDFLYVSGDRNNKMQGISQWIPYGGPTAGVLFNGVDRSAQPTRLAGSWLDGTNGASLRSTLELASSIVSTQSAGSKLTHFLMCPKDFYRLNVELDQKVQIVKESVAQIGFTGISVVGQQTAPITCLPDRNCPAGSIFGINKDTWELASVKKAVRIDDADGNTWLRQASDSGLEIRFKSFSQVICHAPRMNINIKVPV